MQFENSLEPIHTRIYLFTLHKTLVDAKNWSYQNLCVYSHSNHRFEEVTPCFTSNSLDKLKDEIIIELDLQKDNQEIS